MASSAGNASRGFDTRRAIPLHGVCCGCRGIFFLLFRVAGFCFAPVSADVRFVFGLYFVFNVVFACFCAFRVCSYPCSMWWPF